MKTKIHFILLALATMLCNPSILFAQQSNINADNKNILHHETPEDAYLPNAFNNKKVSPAYKYTSITKNNKSQVNNHTKSTGSNIYTIQVNVNSNNQNILSDAANEPSIAVNPNNPNEIVIGWRQFDNVTSNFRQAGYSYSVDAGQSWTYPGVIEPGIFRSDPVLEFDNSGNLFYNSLSSDSGSFPCVLFKSTDGGVTWNNGVPLGGGDKQWMAIDMTSGPGSGNIYSAWTEQYSSCQPGFFTRSTSQGFNFDPCTMVDGSPALGTEAVGPAGEVYIVGRHLNLDSLVVAKSENANIFGSTILWNSPVPVYMDGNIAFSVVNPAGLMGQANIDVDRSAGPGSGNVYVLAALERISNNDPGDIMFSGSTDGGLTWTPAIRINDDSSITNTQWFGTLSVAPNGRIDAVWLDTREDLSLLDSSALYYSYSLDQGNTWSVNEKLSDSFYPHIGYPNQNKLGDYFDMISDNTGAHLAWANTFNGEQDVYYSYIVPPVTTGISENKDNTSITVFPNPTNGTIYISGITESSIVEVYNVLGEKMFSKPINDLIDEIDISNFATGVYFVKIVFEDGSVVVKKVSKG